MCIRAILCLALWWSLSTLTQAASPEEQREFFESRIRPVLAEHCYKCHNDAELAEGGVALDFRDGIRGESEHGTVVVPRDAGASVLLRVLKHEIPGLEMPEDGGQLEPEVIADFQRWIQDGAYDPRETPPTAQELKQATSWEATLAKRKKWWSLQPVERRTPPSGEGHPVDRFLRAGWTAAGLTPARQADRATLLRRLTFVLTGLPPTREQWQAFVIESQSYEALVDELLASTQFGERWARHWMDLVRYTDSHGSEGDPTIPHAYQYRDYLIRAFNADVPYDALVREHIAGDLLPQPRMNDNLGINESLIGPAHWRMVFHGFAPTDALDEKVRFVDDQINVMSKAFLGLTVSCARCHDHKFDAISQADYYALFGILGSCRPALRDANTPDRQRLHVDAIDALKKDIRLQLGAVWESAAREVVAGFGGDSKSWQEAVEKAEAPTDLHLLWKQLRDRVQSGESFAEAFAAEQNIWQEAEANEQRDRARTDAWRWNFANQGDLATWYADGNGLAAAPCDAGSFSLHADGDQAIHRIFPAGVHSPLITRKHRAFLHSPKVELDAAYRVWFFVCGEEDPSVRYCVQHYPRNGTVYPIRNVNRDQWYLQDYDLTYWEGDQVHFEVATAKDAPLQVRDRERSWFGLREVIVRRKEEPAPQRNARAWLQPLFAQAAGRPPQSAKQLAELWSEAIRQASQDWSAGACTDEQAQWLDQHLRQDLLPNDVEAMPAALKHLVTQYRELEEEIPLPTRVPGVAESVGEAQPLFVRGDHKQPADSIPRRFLEAVDPSPITTEQSGRLELGEKMMARNNPLAARVIVNRLWHHLFGRGIVATPDNFGRLGARPTHPELLDYLAHRFVAEGQSMKAMIRFLLMSQSWQAESTASTRAQQIDPENKWLSHANVRRLDAESIRDALLSVSGQLDAKEFGPTVPANGSARRRSIYVAARRNSLDAFLQAFNAPVPFATKGNRDVTNVPAQSLTMLNSPFVTELAALWAEDAPASSLDVEQRIGHMFRAALGRDPQSLEAEFLADYVEPLEDELTRRRQDIAEGQRQLAVLEQNQAGLLDPVRERLRKSQASSASPVPTPVAHWDFRVDLTDRIGSLDGRVRGKLKRNERGLVLRGKGHVATEAAQTPLEAKTLTATVHLQSLEQRGGGVVTVQTLDGGVFDSIVFGERQPGKWMAGSDGFRRTLDVEGPVETAKETVHLAVAYGADGTIRLYRNGQPYGESFRKAPLQRYAAGKWQVLFGLRHSDENPSKLLRGEVLEAAVFDRALSAEEVASLALGSEYVREEDVIAALTDSQRDVYERRSREMQSLRDRLAAWGDPPAESAAWARLAHALFNMKEFIYLK